MIGNNHLFIGEDTRTRENPSEPERKKEIETESETENTNDTERHVKYALDCGIGIR